MNAHEEVITLERIQLAAQAVMPAGLSGVELAYHENFIANSLTMRLTAYVYGQTGDRAHASKAYYEANLPTWIPRWLRNRWQRRCTISVDATPMLVYPDAHVAFPELGRPVQILRRDSGPA